jgi:type VI secretion system secreted protein Hcp
MPIYMKFDGIDGDVTAQGHEKWIEIHSISMGAANPPGTERASSPSVSEIVVTKSTDISSVKLMLATTGGNLLNGGRIDFTNVGEGQDQVYMKYTLENVLVTSFQVSGDGNSRPMESLSLNFTKVTYQTIHRGADGSVIASPSGFWDNRR